MGDLIKSIKYFFKRVGYEKAVIGLSGGLDSSLTLKLIVEALGNKNVYAILMPEKGVTKKSSVDDAIKLCKELKVKRKIIEISRFLRPYKRLRWKSNLAIANTKARIRANILYCYANTKKALVVGTSNKTELLLGYGTKHGDIAADLFVLGNLYKTDVFKLAKKLKLPENIIKKTPSAELYRGQTDEAELGASYSKIDRILRLIEKKQIKTLKNKKIYQKIIKRINENKHKSKTPFTIK
jgi:NAD+ synthase